MIDLKKEIEKLKTYECEVERTQHIQWMKDCYLKQDLDNLLDQYNIITAPKTIKLSEIVEKLKDRIKKGHTNQNIIIDKDKNFITLFYVEKLGKTEFKNKIVSFWNNDKIGMPENTNFKWLYTLWIAGTIIEDDLKEEE